MQEIPDRRDHTELRRLDAVEHVVPTDHDETGCGDRPARQVDERGKRDHRHTDCENHLRDEMIEMEAEAPPETHDGEFDQHEPDAAREQKAADIAGTAALSVQKRRNPRQKDKGWRAEMRNPARQEQRRIGDVARIKSAGSKEIACVIERHHDHDQTAQEIDRIEASRVRRRGFFKGRFAGRRHGPPQRFEGNSHDRLFPGVTMRTSCAPCDAVLLHSQVVQP